MRLFLDIDGVMVPAKGWKQPELLSDGFPAFSSKAIHVLRNLVSEDTLVMLITSHRGSFSVDEWKAIFKLRGIDVEHIVCFPKNTENLSR